MSEVLEAHRARLEALEMALVALVRQMPSPTQEHVAAALGRYISTMDQFSTVTNPNAARMLNESAEASNRLLVMLRNPLPGET